MTITDRTRKSLWAKSGNRCSICKTLLFLDKEDLQEANIGEECHIISSQLNGPRHKPTIADYDLFDNLILLCRNHHRQIDELTDTYTEELLRYIKLNHEKWVHETLHNALKPDKSIMPKFLTRITSGKELLDIISDAYGYRTDYDEVENEEDADFVGGVFQDLTDNGDFCNTAEPYDKVKIGVELKKLLNEIDRKGYYLFGEKGIERIKYENGKTDDWSIATLVLKKKDRSEIIKFDLNTNESNSIS